VSNAVNEIDVIQTSLLRALASPHRLRLIHLLGEGPREVRDLASQLGLGQATVSQHLAAMRSVGLVEATRDGRFVRYGLADPEILEACDLMRAVIVRRLSALGSLAAADAAGATAAAEAAGATDPAATASIAFALPASQVIHR
jgi:ArsR family transcriptional regulator